MTKTLAGLYDQKQEYIDEMKAISLKAKGSDDQMLTVNDSKRFEELESKIKDTNTRIQQQNDIEGDININKILMKKYSGNGTSEELDQADENSVFTYYKKSKEEDPTSRNAVANFVRKNFDVHPEVDKLSPGEYIRAILGGPKTKNQERALSEGTNSAGGFTVPAITSAMILDNVRAKSHVLRSGAQVVLLDSNQQTIAKITADPTVAWLAENAAITASDATFGAVPFAAKSLKCTVKASFELVQDSLNLGKAIDMSLTGAFANEIDRVAIQGAGTSTEPKGIFNYTSPSVLSMGTNGAAITSWDTLIDAIKVMLDNNCDVPNAAIMHPRTWQALMKLKDTTNQYISLPKTLQGITFNESSKVSIAQTQGSSSVASSIYMGGFENLFYGQRLQTTIIPTNESLASNGQFSFVCIARGDFQPYREQAFGLIKGIL